MWNYTQEDWLKEVKRSLKLEQDPVFLKKITDEKSIFPFSKKLEASSLQKDVACGKPFLTIQNYNDLKKSDLDEWIKDGDVGLRFRQLIDLRDFNDLSVLNDKSLFLSQPFPFLLEDREKETLSSFKSKDFHINLGWSPLSFGLTRGEILKRPYAGWENIFNQQEIHGANCTWFYLSSAPYQWAGAEPHVELSVVLSLAFNVLKELDSLGFSIEQVKDKISFGLSLDTDILLESAKITALKTLWQRLVEVASESSVSGAKVDVYALPSLRHFSGRDPWNNIMRLTLMSFAAFSGGAQGFKCVPYDVLNKHKTADATRVSTNIPLILKKEGFVNLVENPFDGNSLFTESVNALCEAAWAHFQEIERKGGVFEAVRSGWLQAEVKRSGEISKNATSYREKELVGINKFIAKDTNYIKGQASQIIKLNDIIDSVFLKKSDDDYLSVEPLTISSLSYEWEKMQCQSDQYLISKGHRPSVPMIKGGGPICEKKAHWIQSLLHLGGLEEKLSTPEDIASLDGHQPLVIILPANDEAEEIMVAALKAKGFEKIWSTGSGRTTLAIDRYIDKDMNALEFVEGVHRLCVEML